MKAQDVTDTLDLALAASGCDPVRIVHKPRAIAVVRFEGTPAFMTELSGPSGI